MKPNYVKLLLVLLLPGILVTNTVFAKTDKKTEQPASTNSVVNSESTDDKTSEKAAKNASKAEKQKALALSKRPKVVGKDKLDKEAKGLRKLSKQAIQNWRKGRLNPDFSAN